MKKKSTIELVVGGAMPFTALILIGLINFVTFGFKLPDASFWIDAVVNTTALLFFFIPFKSIFMSKYMESERIKTKQEEYSELVGKIYDNRLIAFQDWTAVEYNKRKESVVKLALQDLRLEDAEKVFNSYNLDIKKIKADKVLSPKQKKIMINLIKKLSRIKQINADECLPGIESTTQDRRITSSLAKEDKKLTALKVLKSLIICAGIAMLTVTTDFSDIGTRYIAILTTLGLKLLVGLWHIYGAGRVANVLVNNVYFNELSEKSLVISEFLEISKGVQL